MATSPRYTHPYDPLGINPDNLIPDELHTLTPVPSSHYNFIVPKKAPFFRSGLILTHSITGKHLIEGQDFWLGHELKLPENNQRESVYGSITFVDPGLGGTVTLKQYRSLGGPFVLDQQDILKLLAQRLFDPRKRHWKDVITPPDFPPAPHETDGEDLVDLDAVLAGIKELTLALHGLPGREVRVALANVQGLSTELVQRANISGAYKAAVGTHYKLANDNGKLAIRIPAFHTATKAEIKLHLLTDKGNAELIFKGVVPGRHDDEDATEWNVDGEFKGEYDFGNKDLYKGLFDSEHNPYIALDIGSVRAGIVVFKDVILDTNLGHSYIDGWELNSFQHDSNDYKRLRNTTSGNMDINFTPDELRDIVFPVTTLSGDGIHELPANVPNGTTLIVKDTTGKVSGMPQIFKGKFLVNHNGPMRIIDGIRLDKNLGWFKCRFYSSDNVKGHNNFWLITEGN